MRERGPDRTAAASFGAGSVGVTRLAIADLASGHQPILIPGNCGAVGFNGAIYNAGELRGLGLRTGSGNDGEIIWPLYERLGLGFADELEGMYAICIVDESRSRLVLAVDPMGIKPLYLSTEDGWFAASTIQALPAHLRRGAFRVPPGTVMTSDGEAARIRPRRRSCASLSEELGKAVEQQIPAEVPWGCMLSGGLDSSVLAALAVRRSPRAVTISVGLRGSEDLLAARRVAAVLDADHHEELVDEEELPELIDAVIAATTSPDCSAVMGGVGTYVAARAARRLGLKVLLSGEGADELFGGYEEYRFTPRSLLEAELRADQEDLGATECMRLDRCTMAHGVEARVPYLATAVVNHARALPLDEKLDPARSEPKEKIALRRVAAELLPAEWAWRPKVGFSTGAGLMAAGVRLARRLCSDAEADAVRSAPGWADFVVNQRLIGMDERLAAMTFSRWQTLHPELGPWDRLGDRGLRRRYLSEGPYRPFAPALTPQEAKRPGILVLVSPLHTCHPYREWLEDTDCPLLAIASAEVPSSSDFEHVCQVPNWHEDEVVEQALALFRTHGFDRVVGLGEVDVLPAARIREALSLPGQWTESAVAYRDKLAMRRHAAAAGIDVPDFALASDPQEVERFMRQHCGPVVVKPRLGGGSIGVHRLEELWQAAELELAEDRGGHLVEAFVDGPTFHVDALRVGGELVLAVPCAYTADGCLSHLQDQGSGSWTLSESNPLHARLIEATRRVLDAFPGPLNLAVHAEFFLSGEELVLCEIASRCGGIPIPSMLVRRLGQDLRGLWARLQAGLPIELKAVERHLAKAPLVGNFGLPPRNGSVLELPARAPAGVEELTVTCAPGEDFGGERYAKRRSGDFVATWLVTGADEAAVLAALDATAASMERAIRWDYGEVGAAVATPSAGERTN